MRDGSLQGLGKRSSARGRQRERREGPAEKADSSLQTPVIDF